MSGHAVHLDRHAHAVPVHGGRLGELVGEVDDEPVADLGPDERPGNAAVVGPGLHACAGDLDVGDACAEVDLDHPRIGIAIGGLGQPKPASQPGGA